MPESVTSLPTSRSRRRWPPCEKKRERQVRANDFMKTLCNSLLTDGPELKQNRNSFPGDEDENPGPLCCETKSTKWSNFASWRAQVRSSAFRLHCGGQANLTLTTGPGLLAFLAFFRRE